MQEIRCSAHPKVGQDKNKPSECRKGHEEHPSSQRHDGVPESSVEWVLLPHEKLAWLQTACPRMFIIHAGAKEGGVQDWWEGLRSSLPCSACVGQAGEGGGWSIIIVVFMHHSHQHAARLERLVAPRLPPPPPTMTSMTLTDIAGELRAKILRARQRYARLLRVQMRIYRRGWPEMGQTLRVGYLMRQLLRLEGQIDELADLIGTLERMC